MPARTRARKRALDILFESELQGLELGASLAGRVQLNDPPVHEYKIQLVEGVVAEQERIDALLAEHAHGWTLDRMPVVDRNLLRIATYEILFVDDVPDAVAVNQAVELASELSTDESPGFVNGLLAAIIKARSPSAG
jgi:N utilization substance protein B